MKRRLVAAWAQGNPYRSVHSYQSKIHVPNRPQFPKVNVEVYQPTTAEIEGARRPPPPVVPPSPQKFPPTSTDITAGFLEATSLVNPPDIVIQLLAERILGSIAKFSQHELTKMLASIPRNSTTNYDVLITSLSNMLLSKGENLAEVRLVDLFLCLVKLKHTHRPFLEDATAVVLERRSRYYPLLLATIIRSLAQLKFMDTRLFKRLLEEAMAPNGTEKWSAEVVNRTLEACAWTGYEDPALFQICTTVARSRPFSTPQAVTLWRLLERLSISDPILMEHLSLEASKGQVTVPELMFLVSFVPKNGVATKQFLSQLAKTQVGNQPLKPNDLISVLVGLSEIAKANLFDFELFRHFTRQIIGVANSLKGPEIVLLFDAMSWLRCGQDGMYAVAARLVELPAFLTLQDALIVLVASLRLKLNDKRLTTLLMSTISDKFLELSAELVPQLYWALAELQHNTPGLQQYLEEVILSSRRWNPEQLALIVRGTAIPILREEGVNVRKIPPEYKLFSWTPGTELPENLSAKDLLLLFKVAGRLRQLRLDIMSNAMGRLADLSSGFTTAQRIEFISILANFMAQTTMQQGLLYHAQKITDTIFADSKILDSLDAPSLLSFCFSHFVMGLRPKSMLNAIATLAKAYPTGGTDPKSTLQLSLIACALRIEWNEKSYSHWEVDLPVPALPISPSLAKSLGVTPSVEELRGLPISGIVSRKHFAVVVVEQPVYVEYKGLMRQLPDGPGHLVNRLLGRLSWSRGLLLKPDWPEDEQGQRVILTALLEDKIVRT